MSALILVLLAVTKVGAVENKERVAAPDQAVVQSFPEHGSLSRVPASRWEDAFVTGNGRMGAMIFGNPTNDTIVANHCRLFLPLGNREIVPDLAKYVPELRQIIREKNYGEARKFFIGKAKEQGYPGLIPTDPFHPGLFINIRQRQGSNL